jgi:hypothetical protein
VVAPVEEKAVADEVRVNAPAGNGERLELSIGSKRLGLTTRDLLPILLLILGGVGGYLIYVGLDAKVTLTQTQLREVQQTLQQARINILEKLHEQDLKLAEALTTSERQLNAQTKEIKDLVLAHDYNAGRPTDERMPLELAPQSLPQHEKAH